MRSRIFMKRLCRGGFIFEVFWTLDSTIEKRISADSNGSMQNVPKLNVSFAYKTAQYLPNCHQYRSETNFENVSDILVQPASGIWSDHGRILRFRNHSCHRGQMVGLCSFVTLIHGLSANSAYMS